MKRRPLKQISTFVGKLKTAIKSQPSSVGKTWRPDIYDRFPTFKPTPILDRNTPITTMGSCFAANIRQFLHAKEYHYMPRKQADLCPIGNEWSPPWGEHYNLLSVFQDIKRVFGLWEQDLADVEKLPDGTYRDPYRRGIVSPGLKEFKERNVVLNALFKQSILDADVLIITLGLVEAWSSRLTNDIYCKVPLFDESHLDDPGKNPMAQFRYLSFEDNYNALRGICELLGQECPDKKIILSVSPVPLAATFQNMDLQIANVESKSILRAVAGQVTREFDSVYYFHSYELVLQNLKEPWESDMRHIRQNSVDAIGNEFLRCFSKETVS